MLLSQLDYIYFFHGLAFFLLGAISLSMSRDVPLPRPGWLLGACAFTLGTSLWLNLVAMARGDSAAFSLFRTALIAAGFLLLLEFSRRNHRFQLGATVGPWIHLLLVGAVSGLALAFGLAHLETAVRLLIAAPAVFWLVGHLLLVASRNVVLKKGPAPRLARILAAINLSAFGLFAGLVVPRAPFLPPGWPTAEAFLDLTGIPIQLVRGLLVCGLALSFSALAVSLGSGGYILRKRRILFWVMASSIAAILAGGWRFTDWLGRLNERDAIEQAASSTAQVHDHLSDEMRATDGGVRALTELLNRFHVERNALQPSRLDEVVDLAALASEGWVVYVLDVSGTTVSTSNRGRPDSFLGKNYQVRPYFQAAMAGRPGRLLAQGLVSGIPGYYASLPVRGADGRVLGVAVVKRNIDLESLRASVLDAVYVVSGEGRVLVSNRAGQEKRLLWGSGEGPSSPAATASAGGKAALAMFDHPLAAMEWVSIDGQRHVAVRRSFPDSDWSLLVIRPEKTQVANRFLGIVITLLLGSLVLVSFVVIERQLEAESLIAGKQRRAEGRAREFARQADTDALTGVLNRLGFNGAFSREFERARRYQQPLSMVILDLDHFKRVNDQHGHVAGDQVLIGVARLIERSIRGSDVIARWGGEEFVVLAPMTQGHGAARLAEKLRAQMEATSHAPSGAVTGSFGVAELQPEESIEGLLHRADTALLRAKEGGRNRVECADASIAMPAAREPAAAGQEPERQADSPIEVATGFPPFDSELRVLGLALEEFVKMVASSPAEEVQIALESVITGMAALFKDEEVLMAEFDYPLQVRHREVHTLFLDDAHRYIEELESNGVTQNFLGWTRGRLVEWTRFHVLAHDVELGQFLRRAGAVEGAEHQLPGMG